MIPVRIFFFKIISLTAFLLLPFTAFAGVQFGTMTYSIPGTGAAGIPTLSGTMLIVLSLLLFLVAVRITKQKGAKNNKFFLTLLGAFALSSSIGGIKTISDVNAGITQQTVSLALNLSPTTGSVDLFGPGSTNYFDNPFTVPATITAINIETGFLCFIPNIAARPIDTNAPTCSDEAPNNIIQSGEQCQISCISTDFLSDQRLKHSIKPLVKLENDIQLYSFKYKGKNKQTYVGAMAQDLLQDNRYKHSVMKMPNDYYGVNYRALGLKMIKLEQWQKSPDSIYSN